MATAPALSLGFQVSATWRSFRTAVLLALGLLGVGVLLYVADLYLIGGRRRFVENPSDVMVRAFGLAHFSVGWFFMFTSPRLRSGPALARLGMLTLIGAGLCFGSWAGGGTKNPLILMVYYAYFLYHEVRDEADLCEAYGDAPSAPGRSSFLWRLGATVTLGLMTVFAILFMVRGRVQEKLEHLVADPEPLLVLLVGGCCLASGASAWATWRCVRRHQIDLASYQPILAVYASLAGILILGSLFGSVGFNLIILIHGMTWLVFVSQRLRGAPSPPGWWAWLRRTPAGLIAMHILVTAVVLLLMALRVYIWERGGFVSQLFATSSFHYWTIMHITMAMWRK